MYKFLWTISHKLKEELGVAEVHFLEEDDELKQSTDLVQNSKLQSTAQPRQLGVEVVVHLVEEAIPQSVEHQIWLP